MTTIAYKSNTMACDSAWTDESDIVATLLNKLVRLSSGAVIGEAGDNDSRAVRELVDKIKCFDKLPSAKDFADTKVDYAGIIAFQNGEVAQIEIGHDDKMGWYAQVYKVNRGMAAVGSGSHLAIGFMGAGRSAAEAVNFACGWDPHSRLPVHVMQVRAVRKKLAQPDRKRPRTG